MRMRLSGWRETRGEGPSLLGSYLVRKYLRPRMSSEPGDLDVEMRLKFQAEEIAKMSITTRPFLDKDRRWKF